MKMKRNILWMGMLVIILAFGMTVVGCDNDSTDDNGGGGNGGGGGGGTLTITNIPSEYNGKYAMYTESRSTPSALGLFGCQSINVSTGVFTAVQISNGSVSLPMWVQGNGGFTRFSGNHTVGDGRNLVAILNTATFSSSVDNVLDGKHFESVTFTNGNATISWGNTSGNGGGGNPPAGTPVPGATLAAKLAWLKTNAASNTVYTLTLEADESMPPTPTNNLNDNNNLSYSGKTGVTIHLSGGTTAKTVSFSSSTSAGSLFVVRSGVTLVLDSGVTLQGRNGSNNMITVIDGALVMNAGAKITGNTTTAYGGNVRVDSNGTFTMNGGEISGNGGNSGGMYVANNGTFTMNGGKISGNGNSGGVNVAGTFTMNGGEISGNTNSSSSGGGGVNVANNGTFTMNGGEISGNTDNGSVSVGGGGVYVAGTFTMTGGTISGNTAPSFSGGGGGVYVANGGILTKEITGGTIYGYDADDTVNSNTVKNTYGAVVNNQGHAVYVSKGSNTYYRRETTAGPEVNLDSTKSGAAGGWEN